MHLVIDGELIETTPEHPFYTIDGEWVEAENLTIGDLIWSLDGDYGAVEDIDLIHTQQPMYNLTVDEAHTFFVGSGDWLVHNTCRVDFPDVNEALYPGLEVLEIHDPDRYAQLAQLYEAKELTLVSVENTVGGMLKGNSMIVGISGYPASDASTLVHEMTHGFQPPGLTGRQAEEAAHQAAYDFVERSNLLTQLHPADQKAHHRFVNDPDYLLDTYGKTYLDQIWTDGGPFN